MQEKKIHISIVIPVHNRRELTHNCLLSLQKQTYKNFSVIVVDDGSTDGTSEMMQKEFPEVTIIKGDGNLWWTQATNIGIKFSLQQTTDYIFTLNDDTEASEDLLEKMVQWSQQYPAALFGAFAKNKLTQRDEYGGESFNWFTGNTVNLLDTVPKEFQKGIHTVTHFPGRGLFIPQEVFSAIGFYDEEYLPHTLADYDFTFRAANAGYSIYCNYDAVLYIYPEESGDTKIRRKKSWSNYRQHLFGMKGGGNLKHFFFFAVKNCPKKYLVIFLPVGIIRRMFGYLRDWILGE